MKVTWEYTSIILAAMLFGVVSMAAASPASGDEVWTRIDKSGLSQPGIDGPELPAAYETFRLNKTAVAAILNSAPEEFTYAREVILTMPLPDGSYQRFAIEHSPVVEPGLLVKYPELGATYRGRGIDDPTATARFDFLPNGFRSMILSASGTVIIDPYTSGDTGTYKSYRKGSKPASNTFFCETGGDEIDPLTNSKDLAVENIFADVSAPEVVSGAQLRTYRLAVAATNEYAVAVGGNTVAGTLAAQVLVINRVNAIYERDVALRVIIVSNNDLIVYAGDNTCATLPCTAATDPYANSNGSMMLTENSATLTAVIGIANYDIGHVFSTGGGGVATLGVSCGSGKARGVTGQSNPVGDPFAVDYVAHELGHQFGANHTFNGATGNCAGGNRSSSNSFEPGSGITVMAYAGICGTQNLARHSIDTFHVRSIEAIVAFSQTGNGNTCAAITDTGNTIPALSGPGNFHIPKQTPFALTAAATDIDGDTITYDWQQYDSGIGPGTTTVPNSDSDGTSRPIFRPYLPSVSGIRTFPSLQYILNNANVPPSATGGFLTGELLPVIGRTMNFRVVARDNRLGAGGVTTATSLVTVDAASGPFALTSPNTNLNYAAGSIQTIQWNVAGTANAPVSASNVRISMSTDGGNSFPTVLAANTPNDGSEDVSIPNILSATTRIKIEAVGNIFFDISDTNFSIGVAAEAFISGQIQTTDGVGLRDAQVSIIDPQGSTRSVRTTTFGFYSFDGVQMGNSYTIRVSSRRQRFASRVVQVNSDMADLNFVGLE